MKNGYKGLIMATIKPICPHCNKQFSINIKTIDKLNDALIKCKAELYLIKMKLNKQKSSEPFDGFFDKLRGK